VIPAKWDKTIASEPARPPNGRCGFKLRSESSSGPRAKCYDSLGVFGRDHEFETSRPWPAGADAVGRRKALAPVTEWPEFRNPDFEVMRRLLAGRVIFDGRNLYDPKAMRGYGFTYYGIGRAGDAAA
jgi:hypothetical protein